MARPLTLFILFCIVSLGSCSQMSASRSSRNRRGRSTRVQGIGRVIATPANYLTSAYRSLAGLVASKDESIMPQGSSAASSRRSANAAAATGTPTATAVPAADVGHSHDHDHSHGAEEAEEGGCTDPDAFEVWAATLVSCIIITLVSVIGILVLPIGKYLVHVMRVLVTFAIGALLGDVLYHIIPHTIPVKLEEAEGSALSRTITVRPGFMIDEHGHEVPVGGEDPHGHGTPISQGMLFSRLTVILGGFWMFYLFERMIRGLASGSHHETMFAHTSDGGATGTAASSGRGGVGSRRGSRSGVRVGKGVVVSGKVFPGGADDSTAMGVSNAELGESGDGLDKAPRGSVGGSSTASSWWWDAFFGQVYDVRGDGKLPSFFGGELASVAYVNLLSDAVHNFVDGVTLGVAFSSDFGIGVTTTIAIAFHEIAQEFGDFAILLSAGMAKWQAVLANLTCGGIAILGGVIGAALGTHGDDVRVWVLLSACGGFLYIAASAMLPELVSSGSGASGAGAGGEEGQEQEGGGAVGRRGPGARYWVDCVLDTIGFAVGLVVMYILAITEQEPTC